jgi:hypothetical protein
MLILCFVAMAIQKLVWSESSSCLSLSYFLLVDFKIWSESGIVHENIKINWDIKD